MSTYVIGDVQGCFAELRALLDRIDYDPEDDRLWFAGDLINRGPDSLAVLRFVRGLGQRAVTVLGNHDLHLLAVAEGLTPSRQRDSLAPILEAPDRDALLDWLRCQPLLHRDAGYTLVHAGLPPQWDADTAAACADAVATCLQGPDYRAFLARMYGDQPDLWTPALGGVARLRFIVNCLTRLRFVDAEGRLALDQGGPPGSQPAGLYPWFQAPGRRSAGERIVFGHWSQLGRVAWPEDRVFGVDSGCVWGGALTALRLEDEAVFAQPCAAFS